MNIYEKLSEVQNELKVLKKRYNKFSDFNYRSAEDILDGVKPLLAKHKMVQVLRDEIIQIGDRIYVKATVTVYDIEKDEHIAVSAFAREPETKKGFDESQLTGSASSYARKYALNGMYSIDDVADADTVDNTEEGTPKAPVKKTAAKGKQKPFVKGKYTLNDVLKKGYELHMSKAEILNLWKVEYGSEANSNDGTQAEVIMQQIIDSGEEDFKDTPLK